HCDLAEKALENFKKESDSVALFIEDRDYVPSSNDELPLKDLHRYYSEFCKDSHYRPVSLQIMRKRLEGMGFETHKNRFGVQVYLKANSDYDSETDLF